MSADNQEPHAPRLFQILGLSMMLGAATGGLMTSALLYWNPAGLKDLIAHASEPYLALVLLYAFDSLTFAGVAMSITIMTCLPDPE